MTKNPFAFFVELQQIPDSTFIFDELKKQELFYYFQINQNYYLFFWGEKSIDIDFLYQSVDLIQELDLKKRKLRSSLKGFFLYALEIMETGKDFEILSTNLKPFFWRKVKTIVRQNKKEALQEFLFGSQGSIANTDPTKGLEEKIQSLQNQLNSLQQRVVHLENQNL